MSKETKPRPSSRAKKAPQPKSPPVGKLAIRKDPRVYAQDVTKVAPLHKRIVGIDLGTNCGVAYTDIVPGHPVTGSKMVLGQWSLEVGNYDTAILRHVRLQQFLSILDPDLIMFEDVKFDAPVEQFKGLPLGAVVARIVPTAEFLGGLKTTLATWAALRNVPCEGAPITVIKRWLAGKGNSSKIEMIEACNARFGTNLSTEDYERTGADNIADAAAICGMAVEAYSEGLTSDGAETNDVQPAVPEAG